MRRFGIADRVLWNGAVALLNLTLALGLFATPSLSNAQQLSKIYRVGWFTGGRAETDPRVCWRKAPPFRQAWAEAMRARGYTLGQNLTIECRYTEGRPESAPTLAAELVNLKVDLLVVESTANVRAAKQATRTLPIVMWGVIDPVRRGLVASLARPGANVTGLTDNAGLEILGKYLQLLKEAVPTASRIASLHPPPSAAGDPRPADWRSILETEARALGVTLQPYPLRGPEGLAGSFAAMTTARAEALLLVPSPFFGPHKQRIIGLAAQHRLPAMYPDRDDVVAGGLMAYAPDELETARRLAAYVDRILKGAKPGDLPVEQPDKFMLILNLKTAKALGLTIPPTLLIQAEEVIR
ncbi:MAG TPA: ABC transporter substrate-binding protein [Candidatus Methylomirabilis sp.]|nr:ABC transporter substrate-binding protein [Candidatus Methylomirabilis sp.]